MGFLVTISLSGHVNWSGSYVSSVFLRQSTTDLGSPHQFGQETDKVSVDGFLDTNTGKVRIVCPFPRHPTKNESED
jgi:hypothetical protein